MRRLGAAGVLATVLGVLIAGGSANAQSTGSPLGFVLGPNLLGNPFIGQTLNATDGTWRSPAPSSTYARWEWWHCPQANTTLGCVGIPSATNATSYTLSESDRGWYMRTARYVCYPSSKCNQAGVTPDAQVLLPSAAKGPVSTAPTPTPTPTPTPIPVPTVIATPTPVPTVAPI